MTRKFSLIGITELLMAICALSPSFTGKSAVFLVAVGLEAMIVVSSSFGKVLLRPSLSLLGTMLWAIATFAIVVIRPDLDSGAMFTGFLFGFITLIMLLQNLHFGNIYRCRTLAMQSVLIYGFVLLRSLILAGTNSGVFRLNTNSGMENEAIGNFGIYYSVIFTLPIGLYLLINRKKEIKLIGLVLLTESLLLLFWAQYTIAFIVELATLLIWWLLSKKKKSRAVWIVLIISTVLLIVLFSEALIVSPLLAIAQSIPDTSPMRQRITDLAYMFTGTLYSDNLALDRLERYLDSLRGFASSPVFGKLFRYLFRFGVTHGKPGHNSLFELLNIYGLALGLPLYIFIASFFRRFLRAWRRVDEKYYNLLCTLCISYLLLSCLNPIANLFAMSWIMCHVVPFVPLIGAKEETIRRFSEALKTS